MSKRQSFYQFLMTERNPDSTDEIAQFGIEWNIFTKYGNF